MICVSAFERLFSIIVELGCEILLHVAEEQPPVV